MGYDQPQTETYIQASSAFGATTESQRYIGPPGKKGYVRDIDVDPTANMVGTTTVPEITVGASQGASEYARFRLGTTAILGYTSAAGPRRATQVSNRKKTFDDFAGHVKLSQDNVPATVIPADTAFFISRVAGTGGVPAGTGTSRVTIDWY